MTVCESCKGSGVNLGAKGAGAVDAFGNKVATQGTSGSQAVAVKCMACLGKGYYA
jgi:DnaJ-class molecular chaperone